MHSTSMTKSDPTSTGDAPRQALAKIDTTDHEKELAGDDGLFRALVSGCHVENAAIAAGVSERTAYRRLADPEFRSRLNQAREALRSSILAKLADAGHDAIGVLIDLMQSAEDESIRLKAAKTVLDSLSGFHSKTQSVESDPPTAQSRIVLVLPDDGREKGLADSIRANVGNCQNV